MADTPEQLIQQGDPRETLQEVVRAIRRNAVRVVFTVHERPNVRGVVFEGSYESALSLSELS